MSARADRKKSRLRCRAKRRYRSDDAAQEGAQEYVERHVIHYPIDAYHCKVCGYWHIGHAWRAAENQFRTYLASARE